MRDALHVLLPRTPLRRPLQLLLLG